MVGSGSGLFLQVHQASTHNLDQADDQGIAHAEIAEVLRHTSIRPVVREAIKTLTLDRGQESQGPL